MIGSILGVIFAIGLVVAAVQHDIGTVSQSYLVAGIVLIGGAVLQFLLPRTIGMAAVGVVIGGLLAFAVVLVTGQFGQVLPMLLIALAGVLVGQLAMLTIRRRDQFV